MEQYWQNMTPENINHFLSSSGAALAALLGITLFVALVITFLIALGFYIYFSLALKSLAKKLGYQKAWLAWIPVANLFLLPVLTGKKWYWGFLLFVPFLNAIFLTICLWNLFEKRGYDGKWGLIGLGWLLMSPPFKGIIFLASLVALGFLAWGKK